MLFLFSSLDSCPHRRIFYLKLFLTLSVGGQLNGVVHSVSCNCSVSRNQPESTIPCTSSPGASTASVDDTRSILSNTPVAPALKIQKEKIHAFKWHTSNVYYVLCVSIEWKEELIHWGLQLLKKHFLKSNKNNAGPIKNNTSAVFSWS